VLNVIMPNVVTLSVFVLSVVVSSVMKRSSLLDPFVTYIEKKVL
jgi:hypothetical protein